MVPSKGDVTGYTYKGCIATRMRKSPSEWRMGSVVEVPQSTVLARALFRLSLRPAGAGYMPPVLETTTRKLPTTGTGIPVPRLGASRAVSRPALCGLVVVWYLCACLCPVRAPRVRVMAV